MDDLAYAVQNALFINTERKDVPQRYSNMAVAVRDAFVATEKSLQHEAEVAARDYTPEARERRMADVNAAHDKMIHDAADAFKAEVSKEIVGAQSRLRAAEVGKVDSALEIECRAGLLALDELVREQHFSEGCRTGNTLVIAAVLNALPFAPVVRPEVIVAGEKIRAHAQAPEVVSMLNALEQLLAEVEQAERAVRRRCGLMSTEIEFLGEALAIEDDA